MAVIPFEPELFGNAANNGRMLGETDAKHPVVSMVNDIAHVLTGRSEPKPKRSRPRLGRPARQAEAGRITAAGRSPMFGKRANEIADRPTPSRPETPAARPLPAQKPAALAAAALQAGAQGQPLGRRPPRCRDRACADRRPRAARERGESYYDTKSQVFSALIDTIDLSQLASSTLESAREEIRDIVNDIIAIKNFAMSIAEQEELLEDICNDVLGYGPLEPLLARDDIADIMVNGSGQVFIEVNGKVEETNIRFRDNQQLLNICQRIVSQVGRRVDESSPDLRRPPAGRLARQRHRAAAVASTARRSPSASSRRTS